MDTNPVAFVAFFLAAVGVLALALLSLADARARREPIDVSRDDEEPDGV